MKDGCGRDESERELTHKATIRLSGVVPLNGAKQWLSISASVEKHCHTVRVRRCQRHALFFEYMFRNIVTAVGNSEIVAQARISVLVIRRCVTHRLAALLPTVQAVRYASCTACCRWDRVNKHKANDTHRSGPVLASLQVT